MWENFFSPRSFVQPRSSAFDHAFLRRAFSSPHRPYQSATYSPTRVAILGFIGLNAAVFGAWQYAVNKRDRSLLTNLTQNFTLSIPNYRAGRIWTLLTSTISHQTLSHFAFNMISFYAFATVVTAAGVGASPIISLCVGSGLAGSCAWYIQQLNKPSSGAGYSSALGASGVVMGMGAAATCLMPFAPMQLMLIPIPVPLWAVTLAYVALDTYYLDKRTSVGHSAHLGGSVYGAAFYLLFLSRFGGISRMLR